MSEQHRKTPEFYLTAPQPCPYLANRLERKLFTHITHEKPRELIDGLLQGGFRRSLNIAYMPHCEGCNACVATRVIVPEFEPGRTMRRITARNGDLVARRIRPQPTSEHYELFRKYIDARHGDGGMAEMTVLDFAMMIEDSLLDTFLTEYRLRPADPLERRSNEWPLVAVALLDTLPDGLSMVYSFYDPDLAERSLGTMMILDTIALARHLGLGYVYLGYWIAGSRKMSYKARFLPQERLSPEGWVRTSPA